MTIQTEEEWNKEAHAHWDYIEEVIRNHVEKPRDPHIKKWKEAYIAGMVNGYNQERAYHWADVLNSYREHNKDTTDETTFFHYRTSYKHGKKHRDEDLKLTPTCNIGCVDSLKPHKEFFNFVMDTSQ